MSRRRAASRGLTGLAIFLLPLATMSSAAAAPEGTLTFAMHFSPVPRWLDPAEGESTITPYLLLYALHDALLKPMPGTVPRAEPGRVVVDGQGRPSAEFTLRPG